MNDESWHSATLRFFTVNLSTKKVLNGEDSVFLVRAADSMAAFSRFLELGRRNEATYKNHLDEQIQKKFAAIVTLDIIDGEDPSGVELLSVPVQHADSQFNVDDPSDPAKSRPMQSI